jgi:hypothetical protein
MSSAIAS